MTGRVFSVKRFAVHDGDGVRTTVFLKGCPLRCKWCHNPEGLEGTPQLALYAQKCISCGLCAAACPNGAQSISPRGVDRERCEACGKCAAVCPEKALELFGEEMDTDALLPKLLEDRDFYEESGGGVTLSGGECLLQADFCAELLKKLKASGVRTAVDTCGCVPWRSFEKVLPYTDVFLYDVKAIDEQTHIRCTGRSNKLILENLQKLRTCGAQVEVRIPYVPDFTDREIPAIGAFLQKLGGIRAVRVLPYHNYAGSKYEALGMENTLPDRLPTSEEIAAAEQMMRDHGLTVIPS
ncbi:MAG: glycyl-radical enzyme activating protein [Oscillospiraceae bacterium]|nr:glycyl-radical enzyme activating protein [Oscillospiraceae bacterium]